MGDCLAARRAEVCLNNLRRLCCRSHLRRLRALPSSNPNRADLLIADCVVWLPRGKGMFRHVTLILALLVTSAAADDYRSYREAYAGVNWPNSITSTAQCQRRVADLVAQFGFTNSEVKTSPWTGDPDLWVKDPTRHFRIAFGCDPRKRLVTINVDSEQNQVGSAADLLDTLINSLTAP